MRSLLIPFVFLVSLTSVVCADDKPRFSADAIALFEELTQAYDLNGKRMHSYNRIVIATGAPPANQRYLVQFTVTGYADEAQAEASDIEAIIAGFNVAKK